MNDTDIAEILKLLRTGINNSDWDNVAEAVEYLEEFSELNGDDT